MVYIWYTVYGVNIWIKLITTSRRDRTLEIMVSMVNYPEMALVQVGEIISYNFIYSENPFVLALCCCVKSGVALVARSSNCYENAYVLSPFSAFWDSSYLAVVLAGFVSPLYLSRWYNDMIFPSFCWSQILVTGNHLILDGLSSHRCECWTYTHTCSMMRCSTSHHTCII